MPLEVVTGKVDPEIVERARRESGLTDASVSVLLRAALAVLAGVGLTEAIKAATAPKVGGNRRPRRTADTATVRTD